MSLVNQSIIKHKIGLLRLAEELQNVSQACRVMGVSRDTFYRVKEAKETGGMEALLHKDRWRANLKNRMDESIERAILAFAIENPAAGQVRVANELRKRAMSVSPTGVRSVWLRTGLQTFNLRLIRNHSRNRREFRRSHVDSNARSIVGPRCHLRIRVDPDHRAYICRSYQIGTVNIPRLHLLRVGG